MRNSASWTGRTRLLTLFCLLMLASRIAARGGLRLSGCTTVRGSADARGNGNHRHPCSYDRRHDRRL